MAAIWRAASTRRSIKSIATISEAESGLANEVSGRRAEHVAARVAANGPPTSKQVFAELNRLDPKRWRDAAPPFVTNFKATPLMVGGTLYLNSPLSIGMAVDAKTGAVRWVYNPKSYESGTTTMSARWNQRGVGYWTDGNEERVYWGTGDGYLVAVDAKTGRPIPTFGTNGKVDLMEGLPRAKRGERDYLNALTYSSQSPPFVVRDLVITPASISSLVIKKEQIPGYIRAFDARTGKVRWVFKTVPTPGEFGNDSWESDSWSYAGKVTVWSTMSADEELGRLYLPTNTVAPDYYGGHRPGNNLFAESILCLDLETGRRVWHFQTVHHGLWDYDNPTAPNLLDITVNGTRVKALAQITKQGFVYTSQPRDRRADLADRGTPRADRPTSRAKRRRPHSHFPPGPPPSNARASRRTISSTSRPRFARWRSRRSSRSKSVLYSLRQHCRGRSCSPARRAAATGPARRSTMTRGCCMSPRNRGGASSGSRQRRLEQGGNLNYLQATPRSPSMPGGLPLLKPPYSRITAINMNTGEHAWMTPAGNGDRYRNLPQLKPLNLPPVGGDHSTAGRDAHEDPPHLSLDQGGLERRAAPRGVRQGHRTRARLRGSARSGNRHADDLYRRWKAVHRDDG